MPRRPYTAPPPRRRWKPDSAARVTLSAALSSLPPHRRCRPRRHHRLAPRRLRLAPRLEPDQRHHGYLPASPAAAVRRTSPRCCRRRHRRHCVPRIAAATPPRLASSPPPLTPPPPPSLPSSLSPSSPPLCVAPTARPRAAVPRRPCRLVAIAATLHVTLAALPRCCGAAPRPAATDTARLARRTATQCCASPRRYCRCHCRHRRRHCHSAAPFLPSFLP